LLGALLAWAAGYLGLSLAVRANLRTAQAARQGLEAALQVAFHGGAVSGLLVVGLALLGVSGYFLLLVGADTTEFGQQRQDLDALVAFALGGSMVSLFARLGGGIFAQGATLSRASLDPLEPGDETDPARHATAILELVGDAVGDCAGNAADLFETYAVTLVATMLLGHLLFADLGADLGAELEAAAIGYPLILAGILILTSIVGALFVKLEPAEEVESALLAALARALMVASVLALVLLLPVAWLLFPAALSAGGDGPTLSPWAVLGATAIGLLLTGLMLLITEFYTSAAYRPVRSIAGASRLGPAANLIAGLGVSMQATAAPALMICAAIWAAYALAGVYGVAVAATAMLSTSGLILALAAVGPIAANAKGLARMTQMQAPVQRVILSLDALGNTTKALAKGYAIGSAALAALVLFANYTEALVSAGRALVFSLDHPAVLIGLFIGAMLPYLSSSMAFEAVARAANSLVAELERQRQQAAAMGHASAGIDEERLADRLTGAAIKEMLIPCLLPLAVPLALGFGMQWLMGGDAGSLALGGLLIGSIVTGLLLAISMTIAGGAWGNARQRIEAEALDGGSGLVQQAALSGAAVGESFKDVAGPALNPMIKIINLVALLMVPLL
jgi:K(+)-stimulated pyrophosphate-energized sodium pump